MTTSNRSPSPVDELRLPRAPGVIRQFWARHPVFADVLITGACFLLSSPAAFMEARSEVPGAAVIMAMTTLASCLILLRRRQWPVAAFVLSIVSAMTLLFSVSPIGAPIIAVTSYTLAVYRSTRTCVYALLIGLGSLVLVAGLLLTQQLTELDVAVNVVVGEIVFGVFGALIGANVGNRRRYVAAIIDRSRQLLAERDQQGRLAAAAERTRIAREMHDIVSHSLTVIVALSQGASASTDPERARAATEQISDTARSALREMRMMLGVLREDSDHAGAAPLVPLDEDAAAAAITAARRAGFPVTDRIMGTPPSARELRLAIGRIVQEGLTNAMRHAPGATQISVDIQYGPDAVIIDIINDAASATLREGGFGLRGLHERVTHVGGTLSSAPHTAGRWRMRAQLPVTRENT